MKLASVLARDCNNLDVFRLIAACAVIYGHAFSLSPFDGSVDIFSRYFGHDAGWLAVKVFFFLSGLLVANSLLSKGDPVQFVVARVFRIWPALIVMLVILAFVVGPVLSSLSLSDYFSTSSPFRYVLDNLKLNTNFLLPGVFESNHYKLSVNGSLWTIPSEVACYLVLVSIFTLSFFKVRVLSVLLLLVLLVDPLFQDPYVLSFVPKTISNSLMIPSFVFGAVLAVYKDSIRIDAYSVMGAWGLYYMLGNASYSAYFLCLAFFISVIYLSSLSWIVRLKMKSDVSYGVYLWGFPVQQTISMFFAQYGVLFNQVSSIIISLIIGYVSWYLIEKRSIFLGALMVKQIKMLLSNGGSYSKDARSAAE